MHFECCHPLEPEEIKNCLSEVQDKFNEYLDKMTRKLYNVKCPKCENPVDIDTAKEVIDQLK